MRKTTVTLIIGLVASLSVAAPGDAKPSKETKTTADGLVKTEIDMPGVLFIRPDHGVGGYDSFLIPEATLSYTGKSAKLPADLEIEFAVLLEQSLVDAADAAEIPVMDSPGDCVVQINLGFYDIELELSSKAETLAKAVLVMEFRDSVSGLPLLRYATVNRIENQGTGSSRKRQIREGFDKMVAQLDISTAMRAAGLGAVEARPGCQGSLASRGGRAQPDDGE